jgi:hypothetical protein
VVFAFHVDLWQQAIKPGWHPPVTGAKQFHSGWHKDHSNDGCVEKNGHSHAKAK